MENYYQMQTINIQPSYIPLSITIQPSYNPQQITFADKIMSPMQHSLKGSNYQSLNKFMYPLCRGAKKMLVMGEENCINCAGTGRNIKSNCWSQPCLRRCNNGRVAYCRHEVCNHCNGAGTMAC